MEKAFRASAPRNKSSGGVRCVDARGCRLVERPAAGAQAMEVLMKHFSDIVLPNLQPPHAGTRLIVFSRSDSPFHLCITLPGMTSPGPPSMLSAGMGVRPVAIDPVVVVLLSCSPQQQRPLPAVGGGYARSPAHPARLLPLSQPSLGL